MKRGLIPVGTADLAAMLHLPLDWQVSGVEWDQSRLLLKVYVDGDGLPDMPAGCPPMEIKPTCVIGHGFNGHVAVRTYWPRFEDKTP